MGSGAVLRRICRGPIHRENSLPALPWDGRDRRPSQVPVAVARRVLRISRQDYYQWLNGPVSQCDWDDAHAINALREIHQNSENWSRTRVHAYVQQRRRGCRQSPWKAQSLMKPSSVSQANATSVASSPSTATLALRSMSTSLVSFRNPTNYIAHSLLASGGFRPNYTYNREEPVIGAEQRRSLTMCLTLGRWGTCPTDLPRITLVCLDGVSGRPDGLAFAVKRFSSAWQPTGCYVDDVSKSKLGGHGSEHLVAHLSVHRRRPGGQLLCPRRRDRRCCRIPDDGPFCPLNCTFHGER